MSKYVGMHDVAMVTALLLIVTFEQRRDLRCNDTPIRIT
jgi:hypothetical protein